MRCCPGDDDAPGAVDLLGEASNAMDTAAQLDESAFRRCPGTLLDLYYIGQGRQRQS